MISQLRIYTVNKGMMDGWVSLFKGTLTPILEKFDIKIEGTWVSDDQTQFIWIRSFDDEADMNSKIEARDASPEWNAATDSIRSFLARSDVQLMSPALPEKA